jgi:hypothetical protein
MSIALGVQTALAGSSALESLFYSSLKVGSEKDCKCVTWIQKKVITNYAKIQTVFDAVNIGAIFYYFIHFTFDLASKYFIAILTQSPEFIFYGGILGAVLTGLPLFLGVRSIFVESNENQNSQNNDLQVLEVSGLSKKMTPIFHLTRIVGMVALACISSNGLLLIGTALMVSCNLYQFAKLKWIHITKSFDENSNLIIRSQSDLPNAQITGYSLTFEILSPEIDPSKMEENCSVCITKDKVEKIAFCANHVFCKECIIGHTNSKAPNFLNNATIRMVDTKNYQNGRHTDTTRSFSIQIPEKNIPSCPLCRGTPEKNQLTATVRDINRGIQSATVVLTA